MGFCLFDLSMGDFYFYFIFFLYAGDLCPGRNRRLKDLRGRAGLAFRSCTDRFLGSGRARGNTHRRYSDWYYRHYSHLSGRRSISYPWYPCIRESMGPGRREGTCNSDPGPDFRSRSGRYPNSGRRTCTAYCCTQYSQARYHHSFHPRNCTSRSSISWL